MLFNVKSPRALIKSRWTASDCSNAKCATIRCFACSRGPWHNSPATFNRFFFFSWFIISLMNRRRVGCEWARGTAARKTSFWSTAMRAATKSCRWRFSAMPTWWRAITTCLSLIGRCWVRPRASKFVSKDFLAEIQRKRFCLQLDQLNWRNANQLHSLKSR